MSDFSDISKVEYHPVCSLMMLKAKFKELHYATTEKFLRRKLASLKTYCTRQSLHNVKKYLQRSWEPFVAMWVHCFRKDFCSEQANTNYISEARVSSLKKGLLLW